MPYHKKANSCAMKGKSESQAPRARDTSRHCHRSADWQSAVSRIGNPPTCRIPFGEIPMHRDASGPVCATSQPRSESVAVTRCARNRASCVSWLVWLMIIGWLMITEHADQFAEPLFALAD